MKEKGCIYENLKLVRFFWLLVLEVSLFEIVYLYFLICEGFFYFYCIKVFLIIFYKVIVLIEEIVEVGGRRFLVNIKYFICF